MVTFTVTTLGCKANQYDSELIHGSLVALGYAPRDDRHGCDDVCVINTCAVTGESEAQ
ncbi:MAG: hypothetical protein NTZ78_11545 [Candidatus Aureabacteria bacterium]|nr:hypothetical protein [Candidatus Auribacterota bacterium]